MHNILPFLLLSTILTACAGPKDVQESGIETPSLWNTFAQQDKPNLDAPLLAKADAPVEQQWWKHFSDPTLETLITEALANNKTLAIAKARVEEARANRAGTQSSLFPQIDAVAGVGRGNPGLLGNETIANTSNARVEANWELDLFGRNQSRTAAASAILQSEEASRQAVTVGLLAEVARNYFDLRNIQRQITLTNENLKSQQSTLKITEAQLKGALASDFDVQRAGAQVVTTQAQLPSLQIAYDTTLNRLNVLLGHAPGVKDILLQTPEEFEPLDAQTVIALPATVLATRPDVRVAERRLAASVSEHDAAVADLFPHISLLALFGIEDAGALSANPWSIGGSLVQPLLNFGRIQSQIDASDARQNQAFYAYQRTVLEALEDMENALSNYINETGRNAALRQSVEKNRKAAALARQQYSSGYAGLIDVLVAERNVLDAESSLATSDAKLRKDLINIYAASGGGFEQPS